MPGRRQEHSVSGSERQHSPLRARPQALRTKAPGALPSRHTGLARTRLEKHSLEICTGIIFAVALGCGLGLQSGIPMQEPWNSIGEVAGWAYFAAWSLSFYPQFYSNWRRKSVVGFSFDFAITNVLGFACLSIYYCSFYFDANVRGQYRASHHGAENAVRVNDVFFALHAFLLTSLTLAQVGIYERGSQTVSSICRVAIAVSMAVILFYAGLLAAFPRQFDALSFLYLLSYVKVGVTASKYIPQALLNFRRKSTVGFNIGQMILDLTGGIFSLFQLALEAIVLKDSSLVTGDPVKLCLALLSILYDSLLMYQHYVLYADARKPTLEDSLSSAADDESLLHERD